MGDAVSMGEAKTHLSRLIARVEAGEEIVLRRGDTPVAKVVRYGEPPRPLPRHHGDPFDRLLVAQARIESLPIVSADGQLDAYGIDRRW